VIPVGGFAQGVQVACSDLPANVTCSFGQSSVTLDGVHPSTISLAINASGSLAGRAGKGSLWAIARTMAVAGVLFIPFGRRKRFKAILSVLALAALALAGIGCGGGSASAPTVGIVASYTIHVTANSGMGSAAKTVAVVVNVTK
jgi:hypothetical protein